MDMDKAMYRVRWEGPGEIVDAMTLAPANWTREQVIEKATEEFTRDRGFPPAPPEYEVSVDDFSLTGYHIHQETD